MAETPGMFNNKKRKLKEDTRVARNVRRKRKSVFYDAPEGRAWMEAELPRILKGFSGGDCDVVSGGKVGRAVKKNRLLTDLPAIASPP